MVHDFFGAFEHLQNDLNSYQIEGHYDDTLSDFMRDSAWDQTWDVKALSEHIDKQDRKIVDLGAGDGRLMKRLQDLGVEAEFLGVDSSSAAHNRFLKKQKEFKFKGKYLEFDFIENEIPFTNIDFIYFGSVSINCLTSINIVSKLFKNIEHCLSSNGRFSVSVYTKSSIESFPKLDGILTPEPYTTEEGKERIIWRGLKYNAPYLTHNAFVDRRAEGLDPVLCTNYERIWVEEDIIDIARILDWKVIHRNISYVGDGGAEGYEVATLSFSKNAK